MTAAVKTDRSGAERGSERYGSNTEPFWSAEEAWFWSVAALRARHQGARTSGASKILRSCDPDDIVKSVDLLYRRKQIALTHARILRVWGERGVAPSAVHPVERADFRLWREAMGKLGWVLKSKGIVA